LQTYLAIGHHVDVSTLSGRGDRCIPYPCHYSPAFAFSTLLLPHRFRQASRHDLSCLAAQLRYGVSLFHARSTNREGSAFLPVIVLSACAHQAGTQPITYLLVRACQPTLALSSLTVFTSGSQQS